jgi:hypothetical protein
MCLRDKPYHIFLTPPPRSAACTIVKWLPWQKRKTSLPNSFSIFPNF